MATPKMLPIASFAVSAIATLPPPLVLLCDRVDEHQQDRIASLHPPLQVLNCVWRK
jgi:hypothetical protein